MQYKIINGGVSYDGEYVLENVDIEINDNEKIAIVGRNGCGKTTLLKAIMGEVELESGTGEDEFRVVRSGRPEITYLRQMPFEDETVTLLEEVRKVFKPLLDIEAKMQELLTRMEYDHDERTIRAYTDLNDRYIMLGGMTYKKEYETMIRKFGFTAEDERKPVSEFSGGQRTKLSFIKMLLQKPDILLLDEPTNHLDIETIQWLEDYLRAYSKTLVIVSHDRLFLDRIVNKVYEIEWGETRCYKGNYSYYEQEKEQRFIQQQKDYELQQQEIARLNRLIERFRYKAHKAKMVQSKIKLLERMKIIYAPENADTASFSTNIQPRIPSSRQVLNVSDLVIGYDSPLAKVSFNLEKGQRIGIIGSNGIGKSTLLKTITGAIPALGGNYTFGYHTEVGYFDQQNAQIDGTDSLFDNFSDTYPSLNDTQVRSALGAFRFSGEDVFRSISTLSGGEKVRFALCKLMFSRPNVLILDEPTNHMDIIGKGALEKILENFEGTVIFVSHDRYFIRKIADRLLVFDQDGVKYYGYTYDEYDERRRAMLAETQSETAKKEAAEKPVKKGNYSPGKERAKKQRRMEKLETMIDECAEKIAAMESEMEKPEVYTDYVKLAEIQNELEKMRSQQSDYEDEWAELAEALEE